MFATLIFWRKNPVSIGVEFTQSGLNAMALSAKGRQGLFIDPVRMKQEGDLDIESLDAKRLDTLQQFVSDNKLQGAPACLTLPDDKVVVRYVQTPMLPDKVLRQTVELEIGTSIHLPFEDPVVDVVKVPCINDNELKPGHQTICLIASPRDQVERVVDISQQAGLRPVAIDVSPLAIMRGAGIEALDSEGMTCLVQVSHSGLVLSIFVRSALYFMRSVELSLYEDAATNARVWVNDVAHELERVINFFNFNLSGRERVVDRIYLHALDCDANQLRDALGVRLQREVMWVTPRSSLLCGAEDLIAAGLAMKGRESK